MTPKPSAKEILSRTSCGNGRCACALSVVRGHGLTHCSGHNDPNPSLNVTPSDNVGVLLKCHAGCDQQLVIDGLRRLGAWPEPTDDKPLPPRRPQSPPQSAPAQPAPAPAKPLGKYVCHYDYVEGDKVVFRVVRYSDPKSFRQVRPDHSRSDPKGFRDRTGQHWSWGLEGVTPILYRINELRAAVKAKQRVFVVEGEKDADAAAAMFPPVVATTSPMGAGKWRDQYAQEFAGADVVVIADKDEPNPKTGKRPGAEHARQVAESIDLVAKSVRVLELPGDNVKDLSDWIAADPDNTAERLNELADSSPELRSPTVARMLTATERAMRYYDVLSGRQSGDPNYVGWPTGLTFLKDVAAYFPQDMWLIAAPTGAGKTAMLLTLQKSLDDRDVPSMFATLEQPWEQLMDREMATMTDLDGWKIRSGDLNEQDFVRISDALGKYTQRRSIMLDEASLTTERLEEYVKIAKVKFEVKVVFVDYVQRMGDKNESEYLRVSRISNALARIAREYRVCIVSAAQVSRRGAAGSQGDDPSKPPEPPQLSDLRDSGYLEQDSAVVLALGRREGSRQAVLAVRKNRHGPAGITKDLVFDAPHLRFLEQYD